MYVRQDEVYVSLSEHVALQLNLPMMKDRLARGVERPKTRGV